MDLELGSTQELGRFPPIPYEVTETAGGGITRTPAVIAAHEAAPQALHAEVVHHG